MLQKISFFISCSVFFVSCSNGSKIEQKEDSVKKDTAVNVELSSCSKYFNEAKRLDDILLKATVVNNEIAERAIKAFYEYSSNCKSDTLAPVFLIKAGQVAQSIKKITQAQEFFKKCIEEFPNFRGRGAALFLLAQLYDDASFLNNESEARKIYDQLIREYPDSPYANDAKVCIKNLGKTDEELVQEFLKKN